MADIYDVTNLTNVMQGLHIQKKFSGLDMKYPPKIFINDMTSKLFATLGDIPPATIKNFDGTADINNPAVKTYETRVEAYIGAALEGTAQSWYFDEVDKKDNLV